MPPASLALAGRAPYHWATSEATSATTTAKSLQSLQSCPTLCDPIDDSPPGSLVPGILQARTLEWVAISFSNAWKWKAKVKSLSRVQLSATPRTAAHQAPLSMGFSKQEYWSGVPLPSPWATVDTPKTMQVRMWILRMWIWILCLILNMLAGGKYGTCVQHHFSWKSSWISRLSVQSPLSKFLYETCIFPIFVFTSQQKCVSFSS